MISNISGADVYGLEYPWTPTHSASSGSCTVAFTSYAVRFGNLIYLYVSFNVTDASTAAGHVLYINLPSPLIFRAYSVFHGERAGYSTNMPCIGLGIINDNYIYTTQQDGSSVITTGRVWRLQGWMLDLEV